MDSSVQANGPDGRHSLRRPDHWGHPDHDACGTGFVAQFTTGPQHEVVERALLALQRLSHRGGVDADGASGDGAGLLTAIPHKLITRIIQQLGIHPPRTLGLGMLFIQAGEEARVQREVQSLSRMMGTDCLGWREVPTRPAIIGSRAAETLPAIWQCFLDVWDTAGQAERQLFLLRKRAEAALGNAVYFCSLSSRTVVYKGLLAPWQLREFYPDLQDRDFESQFAIFHQRFSTNTQPAWSLAQPFRLLAHNGEINTIVGNRRWMAAREPDIRRRLQAGAWFQALEKNVSDSASLDNVLELMVHQGYSVEAGLTALVPPVISDISQVSPQMASYVELASWQSEPWDGPAALVFSDGRIVGAKLDRNGLRPLRYTQTSDGWLIAGSETGLADFDEDKIIERQRLGPGEMLLVDIHAGTVLKNGEVLRGIPAHLEHAASKQLHRLPATITRGTARQAENLYGAQPPGSPLCADFAHNGVEVPSAATEESSQVDRISNDSSTAVASERRRLAAALGWSEDQIKFLLQPLSEGREAAFSMGDDTPPAFLSKFRRPLWDYCKQRFAQVTNPPIDPLREAHVMSLETRFGVKFVAEGPLLGEQQLSFLQEQLAPCQTVDMTFDASQGWAGAAQAIERIRDKVRCSHGPSPAMVVVSDRQVNERRAALPVLIAVAAVWKEMIQAGNFHVPLIVETAQAIDTHHVALLLAVGATAVHPYLAMQFAEEYKAGGAANYCHAVNAGLRKVLSRMGISTLASYRNSQSFEIVGLAGELCEQFFESAPHCAEATSLEQVLADYLYNHRIAFCAEHTGPRDAGLYRYRKEGELHATSPDLLRKLHAHIRTRTAESYQDLEALAVQRQPVAIRDLLEIVFRNPLEIGQVEPEAAILRRFSTQAMSVGAISPEAHRTLALAMNRLEARSNTGEGGEDPELYRREPEAASRIKQVASGRFGVTTEYLVHAQEIEIKMAQGSKPGEGGQLPALKVSPYIAKLRGAVPGMALISPPPHHDIYSIEDLEQLIHDLRRVNPGARIGVKLVAGAGVGIIAAGVAKAGAGVITISGHDGGTGASPLSSIKNTGLPWEFGLRDAHCMLVQAGLRENVRLRVDGGLKFARDVIIAALLGADEFGFGTAALLAIGCVMARQCHLNTCPVGIATQDETLRMRFSGKPEMVMSYFHSLASETRRLIARLGASSLGELVGRAEFLQGRTQESSHWLQELLQPVAKSMTRVSPRRIRTGLSRQLLNVLDQRSIPGVLPIVNADRSIGAELSGELLRRSPQSHPGFGRLEFRFNGSAGQSFGAFLISGINFHLAGEANDYVGKGLSGGTIAIDAGQEASARGDVLAGNTVLYGATSGELYIAGRAGERFAVRNSGALAVVEGVGDHACEYMTGGVVLVLGPTGINIGAGMTGGLAYVFPEDVTERSCNLEFVQLAHCSQDEDAALRQVLTRHVLLTASPRAAFLLNCGTRLPMMRLQPRHLPCSIKQTWSPLLHRLQSSPSAAPAQSAVNQHAPLRPAMADPGQYIQGC